jgi:hypothetical protein
MRHVSLRPHPTVSQLGSRDVGKLLCALAEEVAGWLGRELINAQP